MPVVPTLELMAEVYRLDTSGGADSERFRRYLSLCETQPVHPYNPMTSKAEALATVERLIEIDAEGIVDGLAGERTVSIAVLTPGAWTDRWFSDIEHRKNALPFVGFWAGEPVDGEMVAGATVEQVVRLDWQEHNGPAESVRDITAQEGLAQLLAGEHPSGDAETAAAAFEVIADDVDMGTLIAWIHGDEAAQALDYRGIGLAGGDGLAFAREWAAATSDPDRALDTGERPLAGSAALQ